MTTMPSVAASVLSKDQNNNQQMTGVRRGRRGHNDEDDDNDNCGRTSTKASQHCQWGE